MSADEYAKFLRILLGLAMRQGAIKPLSEVAHVDINALVTKPTKTERISAATYARCGEQTGRLPMMPVAPE